MHPDLQTFVTDDLKADPVAWPILDKMTEKDVPAVLKSYAHSQHRLGSTIPLPGKPEEAEAWRNDHLPKLYQAGVLTAPPGTPEEYVITKPDGLPDGLGWNDEIAKEFATTLHKHGIPKAAVPDLMALHQKTMLGTQTALKTSYDEGMAALKTEHGDQFTERQEAGKRLASMIFKTPEELAFFEQTGLGNHPGFLSIIMRLAPLAMQDSSFLKDAKPAGGAVSGDDVRAEIGKIMSDKNHPDYAGYWSKDPKVMAKIDELYKRAYGTGTVDLSGGITVGGKPA